MSRLDDPRGNSGGIGHRRHLAPQGMEVEEQPRGVLILDAGSRQVGSEHLGTLVGQREDGGVRGLYRSFVMLDSVEPIFVGAGIRNIVLIMLVALFHLVHQAENLSYSTDRPEAREAFF